MSALDLDALEALCDAATPGPWVAAPSPWEGVSAPHGDPRDGGSCEIVDCVRGPSHGDAAFIAAAREALPALITRLRAAEARIERVGAILSDEGCDCYCDCDSDGHNADCDLCLACRIDREVSP